METKRRLLWIENCYPINSRSRRIIQTLAEESGWSVSVCAWHRGLEEPGEVAQDTHLLTTRLGYSRQVAKLMHMPAWVRFVREQVHALQPDLVGCSFWDMAWVATRTTPRTTPILYDVVDMPSGPGFMLAGARLLEGLTRQRVTVLLLASRFFEPFYAHWPASRLVLENLPDLPGERPPFVPPPRVPPVVAYVGNVRYASTLTPIIEACRRCNISFHIFGDGSAWPALRNRFRGFAGLRFHGRYRYTDLPAVYEQVDLVWAVYPADDINVRYAISNKFFESIWFGKPAVFAQGTALGEFVTEHGIGFTVDGLNPSAVQTWLEELQADPSRVAATSQALVAYRHEQARALRWQDVRGNLTAFIRDHVAASCSGVTG